MTSQTKKLWDVVIVGGGAAGLSAALILARARRSVLVLDSGAPRNRFAPHMHGVLSRDGYSPLDLVSDGQREVRAADGVIEHMTVSTVSQRRYSGPGFELTTDDGRRIHTRTLVVATGVNDELPAIPGLADQWGRGVVACPYCDGYEARGKRIGVLLGSAIGQHKAQLLREYSTDVVVFTALLGELAVEDRRALIARGISLDGRTINAVVSDGENVSAVQFADGSTVAIDVLFIEPHMVPLDDLLRQLNADQVQTPFGMWTWTDDSFQSSVPGVYAIGALVNPGALVPIAAGAGVTAATAINARLVAVDIDEAIALRGAPIPGEAGEYWQARYLEKGTSWSGNVNAALEREIAGVTPGSALDLGSGEGGDALWLARKGWSVTAVDIAPAALAIGEAAQQPGDDISWIAADLAGWVAPTRYDLVSACFLHSFVELPRDQILRRAAEAVAPGGILLIVGHSGVPHWAGDEEHHHELPPLPTPEDMVAALFNDNPRLSFSDWTVLTQALVERPVTTPDGAAGSITDSVLSLRLREQ